MFVSIPAETVAASGKVLVAARSLHVDVSLSKVIPISSCIKPGPDRIERQVRFGLSLLFRVSSNHSEKI